MIGGLQESANRKFLNISISQIKGDDFVAQKGIKSISLLKIDAEGYEPGVLMGFKMSMAIIDVIQFEYGKANLFNRYFIHDYFNDFGSTFFIGKLYPNGVAFFDSCSWDLDDLIGPNYVMVSRRRVDIMEALKL